MFAEKMKNLSLSGIAFAALVFTILVQCKNDKEISAQSSSQTLPQKQDSLVETPAPKPAIKYTSMIFPAKKKDSAMAAFNKQFSEEDRYTILALNRLDDKNKWRADTLAIPDKIDHSLMMYSPFPTQLDVLKEVKKMVFFSYPIQAYAMYENGKLIKWGPTSMGKKAAQTKRGLMFANWKKELAISTVNSSWKLPYNVNVHNTLGIGWHQYDLPGYPASHSCLRLLMNDAKFLYSWVDTWILSNGGATVKANGTPVIVFGDYQWGRKKSWKKLIDDPKANDISVEELNNIINSNLEKILEEQTKRENVVAATSTEVKPAG